MLLAHFDETEAIVEGLRRRIWRLEVVFADHAIDSALARMREPLMFDIEPAHRDFGYAPRPFTPTRDMFGL